MLSCKPQGSEVFHCGSMGIEQIELIHILIEECDFFGFTLLRRLYKCCETGNSCPSHMNEAVCVSSLLDQHQDNALK